MWEADCQRRRTGKEDEVYGAFTDVTGDIAKIIQLKTPLPAEGIDQTGKFLLCVKNRTGKYEIKPPHRYIKDEVVCVFEAGC